MTERVALVTGGTRGIGAAIACALQKDAHRVVATYQSNDEAANAFSQETGISVYKWDVSDPDACSEGIAKVESEVGPISVLVNNAGITQDTTLQKMTFSQWDTVLRVNLYSCFTMTQPLIAQMRKRGFGRIINISSVNGIKGQRGQTNYCSAKAGMLGFTRALAQECARYGITVNAIAPGYTDTEMVQAVPTQVLDTIIQQIPIGRLGAAEEVGRLAAYLASDAAGFITGETISINGGQHMS